MKRFFLMVVRLRAILPGCGSSGFQGSGRPMEALYQALTEENIRAVASE